MVLHYKSLSIALTFTGDPVKKKNLEKRCQKQVQLFKKNYLINKINSVAFEGTWGGNNFDIYIKFEKCQTSDKFRKIHAWNNMITAVRYFFYFV